MSEILCKKCNSPMYARTGKPTENSTKIYICRHCGNILYVWPDGDEKWESDSNN